MWSQDKTIFIRKTESLHDIGLDDENIAYIKPVMVDGCRYHSVHAADGTPLTVIRERELAVATVRQHNMEPASVH